MATDGGPGRRLLWRGVAATLVIAEMAHLTSHLRVTSSKGSAAGAPTAKPGSGRGSGNESPPPSQSAAFAVLESEVAGLIPNKVLQASASRIGLNITSLFTAILIVSYGVTRPAYDSFYSPLGLRPEDVGLDEKYIIFRGALNVTRELLFAIGLVALARVIYVLVLALTTWIRLASRAPRASRAFSAAVAAAVVLGVCTGAFFLLHPKDRIATLIGFGGAILAMLLLTPVVLRGRKRVVAGCITAMVLAAGSFLFQYYLDSARLEGRKFLESGAVVGTWGFVLAIPYHPVQPVALDGDPAGICKSRASFLLLGGTSGSSAEDFLLVRGAKSDYVARVATRDYEMRFGLSSHVRVACIVGK